MKRIITFCPVVVCLLFAALVSVHRPASAAPPEEVSAPVKAELAKRIDVQLLDTPLGRVVELLQRESGLTVVLDPEVRDLDLANLPISLEAKQMTISDTLDWVCRSAELDWDVIKEVVVVSTQRRIKARYVKTQMYDIRSLLVIVQNFKAPSVDLDAVLSNTSAGGSGRRLSNSAGEDKATQGLFNDDDDDESESTISRGERVQQIVELIRTTIGQPEEWEFFGGDLYSVRYTGDSMIVRTVPENHKAIAEMLKAIEKSTGKMVSIEARFVVVKSDQLEQLIKETGGKTILDKEAAQKVSEKITSLGLGTKTLGIGRTTCFNAQRVFVSALNSKIVTTEGTPIPDTVGYSVTPSTMRSGAVIDVLPTISLEGDQITVIIKSDVVTEMKMSVQRIENEAVVNIGEAPNPVAGNVSVTLQQPEQDLLTYRTTVRIEDGGAVLLSGMSHLLNRENAANAEVVFILRAHITK